MSNIIKKGFASNDNVSIDSDMEKINKHTIGEPLKSDEVYCYKVRLADNKVDRVGDKFSDSALEQIVQLANGLTGIKNHDWEADNQTARLYDAELVVDESETNELGEPLKYVLGKAYTLSKYTDYIDKIRAGLLKEVSIAFENDTNTCSICGKQMHKNEEGIGVCEDGHIAGTMVDGKLCYNELSDIKDLLEFSSVAVPCQKNSAIVKQYAKGENRLMRKAELLIRKFIASKKSLPEEEVKTLEDALDTESVDLTDEDIKELVDENASLKARVKELEDAVAGFDKEREQDKIKGCVSKAFDGCLVTPEVKGLLEKELPWDSFKLDETGEAVVGLDEAMEKLRETYKSLFKSEEEPETKVDETKVEEVKTEEEKVEEPKVEIEIEKKSLQKPSGMTFGTSATGKEVKKCAEYVPNKYQGIVFH